MPYLFLALIIAFGGAYIITEILMDSIEKRYSNSLIETGKLASDLMVRKEQQLLETSRLITYLEGVDHLILNADSEGLRKLILPIAFNSDEDLIHILNNQGTSLISMKRDQSDLGYTFTKGTENLKEFSFVQAVMYNIKDAQGDKFAGLITSDDGDFFFVAGPFYNSEGTLIGVILVGESLRNIIEDMRQETLAQATVYDNTGQPMASTLSDTTPLDHETVSETLSRQSGESLIRNYNHLDIEYSEIVQKGIKIFKL